MNPAHQDGSDCAAYGALIDLPIAEIATAVDALPRPHRRQLAEVAAPTRAGVPFARALAERVPRLPAPAVHDVARWLVQPLVPGFSAALARNGLEPGQAVRVAVAGLFGEWPPALVRLLLELAWEVGDLPSALLDREALERLARPEREPAS